MTYFVGDTLFPVYKFLNDSMELSLSAKSKAHLNWKQSAIEQVPKKYDSLVMDLRWGAALDIIVGVGLLAMTGYVVLGSMTVGPAVFCLSSLGGGELVLLITTLIIAVKKSNANHRVVRACHEKRSIEAIFDTNLSYLGKRLQVGLEERGKMSDEEDEFHVIDAFTLAHRYEEVARLCGEKEIAEVVKTIVKERLEETTVYTENQKARIHRKFSKRIDASLEPTQREKTSNAVDYTFEEE